MRARMFECGRWVCGASLCERLIMVNDLLTEIVAPPEYAVADACRSCLCIGAKLKGPIGGGRKNGASLSLRAAGSPGHPGTPESDLPARHDVLTMRD